MPNATLPTGRDSDPEPVRPCMQGRTPGTGIQGACQGPHLVLLGCALPHDDLLHPHLPAVLAGADSDAPAHAELSRGPHGQASRQVRTLRSPLACKLRMCVSWQERGNESRSRGWAEHVGCWCTNCLLTIKAKIWSCNLLLPMEGCAMHLCTLSKALLPYMQSP